MKVFFFLVGTLDRTKWPWRYHRDFVFIVFLCVYGSRAHSAGAVNCYETQWTMDKLFGEDMLFVDVLFSSNKKMSAGKYL